MLKLHFRFLLGDCARDDAAELGRVAQSCWCGSDLWHGSKQLGMKSRLFFSLSSDLAILKEAHFSMSKSDWKAVERHARGKKLRENFIVLHNVVPLLKQYHGLKYSWIYILDCGEFLKEKSNIRLQKYKISLVKVQCNIKASPMGFHYRKKYRLLCVCVHIHIYIYINTYFKHYKMQIYHFACLQ